MIRNKFLKRVAAIGGLVAMCSSGAYADTRADLGYQRITSAEAGAAVSSVKEALSRNMTLNDLRQMKINISQTSSGVRASFSQASSTTNASGTDLAGDYLVALTIANNERLRAVPGAALESYQSVTMSYMTASSPRNSVLVGFIPNSTATPAPVAGRITLGCDTEPSYVVNLTTMTAAPAKPVC